MEQRWAANIRVDTITETTATASIAMVSTATKDIATVSIAMVSTATKDIATANTVMVSTAAKDIAMVDMAAKVTAMEITTMVNMDITEKSRKIFTARCEPAATICIIRQKAVLGRVRSCIFLQREKA
jgi:hypothetical protein